MALSYEEGTVFLAPLSDGGWARGVVARGGPSGIAFGYFFGPRLSEATDLTTEGLNPAAAVLRARFRDAGLVGGDWPVVGRLPDWDRSHWPMGLFFRRGDGGRIEVLEYAEDDPAVRLSVGAASSTSGLLTDYATRESTLSVALAAKLPPDRGPPIPNTSGARAEEEYRLSPRFAQAVFIQLWFPDVRSRGDEQEAFRDLAIELWLRMDQEQAGIVDGHEFGPDDCLIFLYGPSAERMWRVVEPVLRQSPMAAGGYAVKRYGRADGDPPEELVTWSDTPGEEPVLREAKGGPRIGITHYFKGRRRP